MLHVHHLLRHDDERLVRPMAGAFPASITPSTGWIRSTIDPPWMMPSASPNKRLA